ncbi:unnamed protein product [Rotaria magnacalcarata]|uniref:BPTI/Kunitz inhibitor domain-containing protein n=2 Tax=Rotaria magnacalcarata TaxID=392030 RepID=A0A816UJZ8_9BILA|nr:unnamed protein product [Rotaria magnacalcarata]
MAIYYSYLLLLLFLLLITDLANTASLRSYFRSSSKGSLDRRHSLFAVKNQSSTSELVLLRRRPLLPSSERRKRWTKEEDNDEVEIPIDENIMQQSISTTTIGNQATVLFSLDLNKATEQLNTSDAEYNSDVNSTMISTMADIKYPLLRKDLDEINETDELTTVLMNEDISLSNTTDIEQSIENNNNVASTETVLSLTTSNEIMNINPTESEILSTNVTDINRVVSNESNTNRMISEETEMLSMPISTNQTLEDTSIISQPELSIAAKSESDTSVAVSDYTTIIPGETNDNQTSIDSAATTIASERNTTGIDENKDTTIILHGTQNETISAEEGMTTVAASISYAAKNVTDQEIADTTVLSEITENDASTMITDQDEYSNETINSLPQTTATPICDFSCQCSKQCPYGFEVIDDKCQCDPPCKNYQCFGDDICNITSEGKPSCQPSNGTEHDRPIRCYQPSYEGYHGAIIQYQSRWYYDPNQDKCRPFVYRGSGGNENNFKTLHECHIECITCAPAPNRGTCLGRLSMWYYDYKKNECSQFDYSGCNGNENQFIRKQQCIDTCVTRILNL